MHRTVVITGGGFNYKSTRFAKEIEIKITCTTQIFAQYLPWGVSELVVNGILHECNKPVKKN